MLRRLLAIAVSLVASTLFVAPRRWHERVERELAAGALSTATAAGLVQHGESGQGTPVLVFHGTPGGSDQGVAAFSGYRGIRVIAPSRPGYLGTPVATGRTPVEQADAAMALLDALSVPEAIVVGISGGGPAAIQFTLRHATHVRSLLLLAAVTAPMDVPIDNLLRLPASTEIAGWLRDLLVERAPRLLFPAAWASTPEARRRSQAVARASFPLHSRREGVINDRDQLAGMPNLLLSDITVRTLLIHATGDKHVPHVQSVRAAERIADAELLTIEGGRHESALLAPEATAAIEGFLAERLVNRLAA